MNEVLYHEIGLMFLKFNFSVVAISFIGLWLLYAFFIAFDDTPTDNPTSFSDVVVGSLVIVSVGSILSLFAAFLWIVVMPIAFLMAISFMIRIYRYRDAFFKHKTILNLKK